MKNCDCDNHRETTAEQQSAGGGIHINRREALASALFGVGALGLRAVATGLPVSFLLNPSRATAETVDANAAQYLILCLSSNGDALNCNAPGTYSSTGGFLPGFDGNSMYHADDAAVSGDTRMSRVQFNLGSQTVWGATPWKALAQTMMGSTSVGSRLQFFHYRTQTANHGELNKVLAMFGSLRRGQQAPEFFANTLAPTFKTTQTQPITLGGDSLTFGGRYLPNLSPTGLATLLENPTGVNLQMQKLRDTTLDSLNALFKQNRNKTSYEQDFLDKMSTSQSQLRSLMDNVGAALAGFKDNGATNQALTAALLIKFNVTPIVAIHLPFSGDNHVDTGWNNEATQTTSSIATLQALMNQLYSLKLQDKVTVANSFVFGRVFNTPNGRGHNPSHAVSAIIGKPFKAGVVGGLMADSGKNGVCTGIDSASGSAVASGGDIAPTDTLTSFFRTLGRGIGVPQATLDDQITAGKTVTGALV